jgi:hypothetical protein
MGWELPISAGLHAGLMSIKFGKGIEVWFVQMLILLDARQDYNSSP